MEERKVKLNGTAIAGHTLYNHPRTPNVILGDDAGYLRGDLLDANAVQTKILELIGGAPDVLDTLKELADALDGDPTIIKTLKEWKNKLSGITVSHINHNGTAKGDNNPTFTATATSVALNYDCFSLGSGNMTVHDGTELPQASTTQAGTIDASTYKKITNLTPYSHVHHSGDGTDDPQDTFTTTANNVKFNFQCTNPSVGNTQQYHPEIPVASATNAGIITAADYKSFSRGALPIFTYQNNQEIINVPVGVYLIPDSKVGIDHQFVLPNVSSTPSKTVNVIFYAHVYNGDTAVKVDDDNIIVYADEFSLDAGKTYEIYALHNGMFWIVSSIEVNDTTNYVLSSTSEGGSGE